MAEIRFVVEAHGSCAAPREAILAKDIDPYHFDAIEPRVTVSDVVHGPDGRAQSWTLTAKVAKVFRVRFHCVVMSLDPSIVEMRHEHQSQVSTLTVSEAPDEHGRFALTSRVDVVVTRQYGTAKGLAAREEKLRSSSQAHIERQMAATIAILEAEAARPA
jgi:hypothetical protein